LGGEGGGVVDMVSKGTAKLVPGPLLGPGALIPPVVSFCWGCGFLNFCGPKTGGPRRFDPATYLRGHPLKKNGPRGPARGKGHRGTADGTAAWPAGLPRPPHLVVGPPRCPPRPGRRKNGPERPLGAPDRARGPSAKLCTSFRGTGHGP
jgi:hypothetical protein